MNLAHVTRLEEKSARVTSEPAHLPQEREARGQVVTKGGPLNDRAAKEMQRQKRPFDRLKTKDGRIQIGTILQLQVRELITSYFVNARPSTDTELLLL